MPVYFHTYLHLLFISVIALIPVSNPVASAFIASPYFSGLSKSDKRTAVSKITFYAFVVCSTALFAGRWVLELFGLSVPVIQLAGGIMICKMGWEFLAADKTAEQVNEENENEAYALSYQHLQGKLFYPITFPVTTGTGTISVLFTLSAHSTSLHSAGYMMNSVAVITAIGILCLLIYILYLNTKTIIHYLGSNGEKIVNRIIAFLIFCVGLQIAVAGVKTLMQ